MPLDVRGKFINEEMATDDELALKQDLSEKNQPFGYAGLDAQGKVFSSLLPPLTETTEVIDGGNPTSVYLTQDIDGGNP